MDYFELKFPIKVKCWKDKETGSWLVYSNKYFISAYGKTRRDAEKMFVSQVEEFLKSTIPDTI